MASKRRLHSDRSIFCAPPLGRAAGFEAPATALVAMSDKMPPALLLERFDIRDSRTDTRLLALEDMCSVLDLPTSAKYDGTMERVARAVRPLSTAPDDDRLIIVKRALFAWLIADGDMHLKNMALIKIAESGEKQFRSVRMAPLYDAVTTRVFPKLKHDHLALKLSGKDDRLRRADFHALAATAGLRAGYVEAAINDLLLRPRKQTGFRRARRRYRRSCPRGIDISYRSTSEEDGGSRYTRRYLHGPDCSAGNREGDTTDIA